MNKPMNIDIKRIASLSGLSLDTDSEKSLASDISELVAFADRLADAVPDRNGSVFFPHGERNVLREDIPRPDAEELSRDMLLAASATKADGYITVPLVMDADR